MEQFVKFSRESFIAFFNTMSIGFSFSLIKSDDDNVIFADRFGNVYAWRHLGGENVSSRHITFAKPSLLTYDDFHWLRKIARRKHWKGGVTKLYSYEALEFDVIDKQGIDPYFYAWMYMENYLGHAAEIAHEDPISEIVTKYEYDFIIKSIPFFKSSDPNVDVTETDVEDYISQFVAAKTAGVELNTWMKATIETSRKTRLRQKIKELVNEFVGNSDVADDVIEDVYKIIAPIC